MDDGSALIIVNSQSQQLFAVDPTTGTATEIDLGGGLLPGTGGDGLVRKLGVLHVCVAACVSTVDGALDVGTCCCGKRGCVPHVAEVIVHAVFEIT